MEALAAQHALQCGNILLKSPLRSLGRYPICAVVFLAIVKNQDVSTLVNVLLTLLLKLKDQSLQHLKPKINLRSQLKPLPFVSYAKPR